MGLRIAIVGAGGLGSYFGARLAHGGNSVAFLARGAQLAALRGDGVHVESELGNLHVAPVEATDDPAAIGPVDVAIVSVKLWDTESAARAIEPLLGPRTFAVSLQNGVDKDDVLRARLGADHVAGGAAYIAATLVFPGAVRHTGNVAKLIFGEFDGARSARVEAFAAACAASGIEAEISPDIERATWEKFVFLVGGSGMTTLTRLPMGPIRSNPRSRALLHDAMHETVMVAQARGIALPDDFAERRLAFVDTLPEGFDSSMHADLRRGNRLEVPWLSGAVARMGRELGVPTPVNRVIADALSPLENGRAATTASA